MQSWVAEGRVGPDCLVWREGWRDWQEAPAVFAELRVGEGEPGLVTVPSAGTASEKATAGAPRRPSRQRSTALNVALITLLVLIVIILFGVLMWVITGGAEALGRGSSGAVAPAATAGTTTARP